MNLENTREKIKIKIEEVTRAKSAGDLETRETATNKMRQRKSCVNVRTRRGSTRRVIEVNEL